MRLLAVLSLSVFFIAISHADAGPEAGSAPTLAQRLDEMVKKHRGKVEGQGATFAGTITRGQNGRSGKTVDHVHEIGLEAQKCYRFYVLTVHFFPKVRVRDAAGKQVAEKATKGNRTWFRHCATSYGTFRFGVGWGGGMSAPEGKPEPTTDDYLVGVFAEKR